MTNTQFLLARAAKQNALIMLEENWLPVGKYARYTRALLSVAFQYAPDSETDVLPIRLALEMLTGEIQPSSRTVGGGE